MPVSANPSSDNKQLLVLVGQTLINANGALVGLGNAFIDADSAIGKVAAIFGGLSDSVRADLARVFTDSKIEGIENAETISVSAIRNTKGIMESIINGNLNEIRDGLATLATIIKGQDGNNGVPALAELGKAFSDVGDALAKVATLIDGLSESARIELDIVFAEAGLFLGTDADGGGKADGVKADANSVQYSAKDTQDDADAATLIGNYSDNGSGGAGVDYNFA